MVEGVRAFLQELSKTSAVVKDNLHDFMYYSSLLLLLLTNFVALFLLLPVFLFLRGVEFYIILVLFSILLGFLFNTLIHTLNHLSEKHHIIATILVPTMVLFDIVILIRALDKLNRAFTLYISYNPLTIVLLFMVIFMIPYTVDVFRGKHVVKF